MPGRAHHHGTPTGDDDTQLTRVAVAVVLAYFLIDGIMRSAYFHWGARAVGASPPYRDALLSELTGSVATVVVFFAIVVPMSRRFPLRGARWYRSVLPHAGGLVAFSVVKTTLMWVQRSVLWPVAGLGRYDYGDLAYRFPMEATNDVLGYALLCFAVHMWDQWRERRGRELARARLDARISEARLTALQGQLQPHFLFNTLNVISEVLYDDPERADDLITRLSGLLRATLDAPTHPEVTLERELDILDRYVELMKARFEDRLTVVVDVDADARDAVVPVLLLQPLVENAIQYAVAPRAAPGQVRVSVAAQPDTLVLTVDDDGPGIGGDADAVVGSGVGLGNLRDRLEHLYREEGGLTLENRPEGGLRVRVRMPRRRAGATPDPAGGHGA